jgi:hypothetical protein
MQFKDPKKIIAIFKKKLFQKTKFKNQSQSQSIPKLSTSLANNIKVHIQKDIRVKNNLKLTSQIKINKIRQFSRMIANKCLYRSQIK